LTGGYVVAAVLGYYVSPLLALALFVWMIAYHAITSEGLHATGLAQAFTRTRLFEDVTERRADTKTSPHDESV